MADAAVKRGRGRPAIGERRVISITMTQNDWEKVESLIKSGYADSASDYFRQVHEQFQKKIK